jgi:hypothetical protein
MPKMPYSPHKADGVAGLKMMVLDHGFVYHVNLAAEVPDEIVAQYVSRFRYQNGKQIVIASTRATDERLVNSAYFLAHKESWFSHIYTPGMCLKHDIGLVLTDEEQERLDFMIEVLGEAVVDHGWFETCTMMG